MDCRIRNLPINKRVFGKDITNIEPRRTKNNSISQKPTLITDNRNKSKSFDKKINYETHDPITEYEAEILNFMISIQNKEKIQIMNNVTADMRQILIDWLVDVHYSFELKEQTLYLAFAYLNQFSSCYEINKNEYQLVGITCLWIASKYQEIYPPRMQNYINVTDSAYSAHELKNMEGKILLALKFNLNYTTPLQILEAVCQKWPKDKGKLTRQSMKTLCMSKYLIELSIFEGLGKEYCMKTLVLSSLMLSDSVLKVKSDSKMLDNSKIQKETLMKCFKDMCLILQNVSRPNLKLRAIKKKFSDDKYMSISRFRIEPK